MSGTAVSINSGPKSSSLWQSFFSPFVRLYQRGRKVPFILFYQYLWTHNRPLLFKTFFFNYVAPVVLELLPWWLNRRKVGNKLRSSRIKLNHNMVTAEPFKSAPRWTLMSDFMVRAVLFGGLEATAKLAGNRLEEENKCTWWFPLLIFLLQIVIKRLILERVMYSEPLEFQNVKGNDAALGNKVADEIISTLEFFNTYLPSLLSGIGAFLIEGSELLRKRGNLDPLALSYPVLITLMDRGIANLQKTYFTKREKKQREYFFPPNFISLTTLRP